MTSFQWFPRAAHRVAAMGCALLAACQTTGDPRQGGLFGWSEERAIERQRALQAERDAAQGALQAERQRGAELASRQSQLDAEVRSLQRSLASALAENDALDARLQALIQDRRVADAELGRLQQTLEASRRARAAARRTGSSPAATAGADELARQSQAVNQYNQQLHEAVMLLMGR